MPTVYQPGQLIERVPLRLRNGRDLIATIYATDRPKGRRIRVTDPAAGMTQVFDTDDCHDFGNATNALDFWIAANDDPAPDLAARFAAGWVPAGPGLERTAYDRWAAEQSKLKEWRACDHCGETIDTEDAGQVTVDGVICGPCAVKARNAARALAAEEGRTTAAGDIAHEMENRRLLGKSAE